jgi:hypothetical protein
MKAISLRSVVYIVSMVSLLGLTLTTEDVINRQLWASLSIIIGILISKQLTNQKKYE